MYTSMAQILYWLLKISTKCVKGNGNHKISSTLTTIRFFFIFEMNVFLVILGNKNPSIKLIDFPKSNFVDKWIYFVVVYWRRPCHFTLTHSNIKCRHIELFRLKVMLSFGFLCWFLLVLYIYIFFVSNTKKKSTSLNASALWSTHICIAAHRHTKWYNKNKIKPFKILM